MKNYASIDDFLSETPTAESKPVAVSDTSNTPTPPPTKDTPAPDAGTSDYASIDDFLSGTPSKTTKSAVPKSTANLTTRDGKISSDALETYNATLKQNKQPLSFLQKADLYLNDFSLNIGTGFANSIDYTAKGLAFAKDAVVGATKDVWTDVKTGRLDDLALKIGQTTVSALSGFEKGLGYGKKIIQGTVKGIANDVNGLPDGIGASINKQLSTQDALDQGFDTISQYLAKKAQEFGDLQVNPSHIKEQLKKDDTIDKVLKGTGNFYKKYVAEDMQKELAGIRSTYGESTDVTLTDQVLQGLGQLPLFIATGAGTKALATTVGMTEASAAVSANVVNTILEAGGEAQDVSDTVLKKGGTPDQAATAGLATFGSNVALIGLTNAIDGMFEETTYKGLKRFVSVAGTSLGEAGQEGVQQMISNSQSGEPVLNGVKDSFLVGLIVAAPSAVFFGTPHTDTGHVAVRNQDTNHVPTVEEIQKNPNLDAEQKDTLTKLVNGELTEADKEKIVKDAIQNPEKLADTSHEQAQGTPQYEALQADIKNLLNEGISSAEIAQHLQDQLNVSNEYAQNVVAEAINGLTEAQKTVADNTEQIKKNTEPQTNTYEEIAQKLQSKDLAPEVAQKVAKDLQVAISREGSPADKARAIDILANPTNTASRAVYEELTGVALPTDTKEARQVLTQRINQTPAREHAMGRVAMHFDVAQAGYRVIPEMSHTHGGKEAYGVPSTFPKFISEELRSRKLFDKVMPYYEKGIRPDEKKSPRLAKLYDEMQQATDEFEKQFEAEAIELANKQPSEYDEIPFQAAHDQITNENTISNAEAEAIVRKYFTAKEVPVEFVERLRTPRGTEAWGRYAQQTIEMVNNPRADTAYHESVHAFLDLFVPTYERNRFLATALVDAKLRLGEKEVTNGINKTIRKYNYKISKERAIQIYSEEQLAEGFYEYIQGRNQQSALKTFYDKVIAFLKSFKDEADASRLYEEIISKKRYNKARMEESLTKAMRTIYQQQALQQGKFSEKASSKLKDLPTYLQDKLKTADKVESDNGNTALQVSDFPIAFVTNEKGKSLTWKDLEQAEKGIKNITSSNGKMKVEDHISVQYDVATKTYSFDDGLHRYAQTLFNGDTTIPANIEIIDSKNGFESLLEGDANFQEKPTELIRSSTFAVTPFKNLEGKQPAFKGANESNTETHALTLGTEKVKIEEAKIQKVTGNEDGLYTDGYAVLILQNGKEKMVFNSPKIEEASAWLKENAGKEIDLPKTATVNVYFDGDTAKVIAPNEQNITSLEIANIVASKDVSAIDFYRTDGELFMHHIVEEKDKTNFKEVAIDNSFPKKPIKPDTNPFHNIYSVAETMHFQKEYDRKVKNVEMIRGQIEKLKKLEEEKAKMAIPKKYEDRTPEQRDFLYKYNTLKDTVKKNQSYFDFWSKPETLEKYKPENISENAKASFKKTYIDTVKKEISQGYAIPQEMVQQFPEFTKAINARARYEKGYKTSFANQSTAVNNVTKDIFGFKVKRQDGGVMTDAQINEITQAAYEFERTFGAIKDIVEKADLTVAHTNGKHPFLSDAGGLMHTGEKVITVGVAYKTLNGEDHPVKAFAHEMAHFIDAVAEEIHKTDTYDNKLYREALDSLNGRYRVDSELKITKNLTDEQKDQRKELKLRIGAYWSRRAEVFARLVEEYTAMKSDAKYAANDMSYYENAYGYWSKDAMQKLAPMIEAEIQKKIASARAKTGTEAQNFVSDKVAEEPKAPVNAEIAPVASENTKGTQSVEKSAKQPTEKKQRAKKAVEKTTAEIIAEQKTPAEITQAVEQEVQKEAPTVSLVPKGENLFDFKDARSLFPSYFASIDNKIVSIQNDNVARETSKQETVSGVVTDTVPVDEKKVQRTSTEQTTQTAVMPTEEGKQKPSRAFERAQSRLNEIFQADEVNYSPIKITDQIAKATTLIETNRAYAEAVALGLEQPPLDITDTAISITLAEKAREEGNVVLQAKIEQARSLRQTRRGQEISMEKGRVDENSPDFFINALLDRRKELARQKYKPTLGKAKSFIEVLDERVKEAKKKTGKKLSDAMTMKAQEIDDFLAEIAC